jgi:hypothetical protein
MKLSGSDQQIKWKDACDVRPDACLEFRDLLPEGYLYVRSGGAEFTYYLRDGALFATDFDGGSLASLENVRRALNAHMSVRDCEDEAGTIPVVGIIVAVLGAGLLVASWRGRTRLYRQIRTWVGMALGAPL